MDSSEWNPVDPAKPAGRREIKGLNQAPRCQDPVDRSGSAGANVFCHHLFYLWAWTIIYARRGGANSEGKCELAPGCPSFWLMTPLTARRPDTRGWKPRGVTSEDWQSFTFCAGPHFPEDEHRRSQNEVA